MENPKQNVTEKINFIPKTEEEKIHLSKLTDLLKLKRRGDWKLVAEMTKLEPANVEKAFGRVHSRNHLKVVEALEKITQLRKSLLTK
jgi:hypothetical protein